MRYLSACRRDALCRAMLSRTRPRQAGWAAGEYVFWWRRPHGPARPGVRKGPGVVIGSHEGNHWVSSGGEAAPVAPEQLREAMDEELWSPGFDELTLHENLLDLSEKIKQGDYDGPGERGPGPQPGDLAVARRDVDGLEDFARPLKRRYTGKQIPRAAEETLVPSELIGQQEFNKRKKAFQKERADDETEM